jgi:hypothetical protein
MDRCQSLASLLRQGLPALFVLFDCYTDVARVYLTRWEAAVLSGPDERQAKLKSAAKGASLDLCRQAYSFVLFHRSPVILDPQAIQPAALFTECLHRRDLSFTWT